MQAMTVTAMPRMLPRVEGVEEAARVEEDVGEDVLEDEVRRKRHRRKMLRPGGGPCLKRASCQEPKEPAASQKKKKDAETLTRSLNRSGTSSKDSGPQD